MSKGALKKMKFCFDTSSSAKFFFHFLKISGSIWEILYPVNSLFAPEAITSNLDRYAEKSSLKAEIFVKIPASPILRIWSAAV